MTPVPPTQPPAAPETDVSAVADAIGAELYQSLMEASADEWRRWEFLTDAAKAKYRAEGGRIVREALGPLLADLAAARERVRREPIYAAVERIVAERVRVVEGERDDLQRVLAKRTGSLDMAIASAKRRLARAESAEAALAELRADRNKAWRVAAQRRDEARRYYVAWQVARMRARALRALLGGAS